MKNDSNGTTPMLCVDVWDGYSRDGAKTLLQDAKAGVDAVGASWQGSREETGQERISRPYRPSHGLRQQEAEGEREFDVRCPFASCPSFRLKNTFFSLVLKVALYPEALYLAP